MGLVTCPTPVKGRARNSSSLGGQEKVSDPVFIRKWISFSHICCFCLRTCNFRMA